MNGGAPARVFEDAKPLGGFRQVSEQELAWHTAEHFPDELIEPGGIVALPDTRRYSASLLLLIQGERRECVRLRQNKSFISVLPARKGDEVIFAPLRIAVGSNDRAALAMACEYQARIRKIVGAAFEAPRCDGDVAAPCRPEAPRSVDAIPARDFFEEQMAQNGEPEAAATMETIPEEKPVPSLYDYDEPTWETV